MSREDFMLLTPHEQEDFLNNEGVIDPSIPVCVLETGNSIVEQSTEVQDCPLRDTESVKEVTGNNYVEDVSSIENKQQTQYPALPPDSKAWTEGFDILDPVELLFLLDENIATGVTVLHPWQIQFMLDFANSAHTKDSPFNAEVQACNGSGKDKFVVAACLVWLGMRFRDATGVATNGSGVQLDNQTERYIRRLCKAANTKFNANVWKCNYREYTCLVTNSILILFATDEANKAEGFHPIETGAKLAIFASEAKAIPDDIFTAITRCTGVTHRVDVSTPGLPVGYFFERCSVGIPRKDIADIKSIGSTETVLYHITAYDCPHITESEIEGFASKLAGGKANSVFKSGILSLFGTTDEMVVVPYTYVNYAIHWERHGLVHIPETYNKGGLDLSDGGAENVLVVRNGNKVIAIEAFRFEDTEDTIDYLDEKFKQYHLTHREATINADSCGIGKPMINSLKRRKGWTNLRYIDSRNTAREPKVYLNRGTELFFNVRLLMEHHEILLPFDKLLQTQLATRYYKIDKNNRHQLLTKLEQRAKGYPSPDRADALNLAFWDYKSTWNPNDDKEKPFDDTPIDIKKPVGTLTLKGWAFSNQGKWKANGGLAKKNFSSLEEEVAEYNSRFNN